jgi:hypothetical protein
MVGDACCDRLRAEVERRCPDHPDRLDCPDAALVYLAKFDEYVRPSRDGGSAGQVLTRCPFCGGRLPESRRDAWFDALEERGLSPWGTALPGEFESDRWWRGRR